jgi:F-type H+-transporting ATPase subunit epsilon
MSEGLLKTQIISPDSEIYNGDTDMVVLPGEDGDFAAMFEHAPIITFLRPGRVEVFSKEEQEKIAFFVAGGFVKIQDNNCLVMVDYIRKTSDIDLKENEKKISELLFKLENTEDQIVKDNLIVDIDLIRSENEASE